MKIKIVCATRMSLDEFWSDSMLGRSIKNIEKTFCNKAEVHIYANNKTSLSIIYNLVIKQCIDDPSILVFVHDDVYIYDFGFIDHVKRASEKYDMAGIAGITRRIPNKPNWYFLDYDNDEKTFGAENELYMSGFIGHGTENDFRLSYFGDSNQKVKLLDGVLLIMKSATMLENNILFDEQFDFHMYDMDICRQFEKKGLIMGTYPISIIHKSTGNYTGIWKDEYNKYIQKWGS